MQLSVHKGLDLSARDHEFNTLDKDLIFGQCGSVDPAGSNNESAGAFLGSVAVTLANTGNVSITPPWTLTLVSSAYEGVSQAFGLTQPTATATGVSGVAADTWNILWPQSTNQVTLGFVVMASNASFAPTAVGLLHPPPPPGPCNRSLNASQPVGGGKAEREC